MREGLQQVAVKGVELAVAARDEQAADHAAVATAADQHLLAVALDAHRGGEGRAVAAQQPPGVLAHERVVGALAVADDGAVHVLGREVVFLPEHEHQVVEGDLRDQRLDGALHAAVDDRVAQRRGDVREHALLAARAGDRGEEVVQLLAPGVEHALDALAALLVRGRGHAHRGGAERLAGDVEDLGDQRAARARVAPRGAAPGRPRPVAVVRGSAAGAPAEVALDTVLVDGVHVARVGAAVRGEQRDQHVQRVGQRPAPAHGLLEDLVRLVREPRAGAQQVHLRVQRAGRVRGLARHAVISRRPAPAAGAGRLRVRYSISSLSSDPGSGRSAITGSRPPRRIELPSYRVRWSIGGGAVQSVSFICPLWPYAASAFA